MTGEGGGRYSSQRDGNLSGLIKHIRDDGPAETPVATLVERLSRPVPAPPPAPAPMAPPKPNVSLMPPAGPAPGRSRLPTGWKRAAVAVVGGAVVALAVTVGLWLDRSAPSLPAPGSAHPADSMAPDSVDLHAELRQLAASVAAMQGLIEGLAQDSQITSGEVKQLFAQGLKANSDRIDQLKTSVERTQQAQSELRVRADRIENMGNRGVRADAHPGNSARASDVAPAVAREAAGPATSGAVPALNGEGDAHGAAGAAIGQAASIAAAVPRPAGAPRAAEPAAAAAVGQAPSEDDSRPGPAKATEVHPPKTDSASTSATAALDAEPSPAGSEADGAAAPDGAQEEHWAINLVAIASRDRAEAAQAAFEDKGVLAHVVELRRSGSQATLYGVSILGFTSRAEAAAFAPKVKAKLGISEVWIFRR